MCCLHMAQARSWPFQRTMNPVPAAQGTPSIIARVDTFPHVQAAGLVHVFDAFQEELARACPAELALEIELVGFHVLREVAGFQT